MKTTLLILIAIFTTTIVNGQWYYNHHDVTNMNELTEIQLDISLTQAQNLKSAGVIVTVISTASMIVGTVMHKNGLKEITSSNTYEEINDGVNKGMNGAYIMYAGAAGMGLGIPLWIVGGQRMNNIKIHLAKFDPMAYNSPKLGVGFSYKF